MTTIKDIYEEEIREAFCKTESFLGETFRITTNNPNELCDYIKQIKNPFIDVVEVDGNDVIIIYHTASYLAAEDCVYKLDDFSRNESYIRHQKLKDDTIIDENKSVKWNRDEVQRLNEEVKQKIVNERHYHNLIDKAVASVIKESVNSWYMEEFTDEAISIIYSKAWEDGHSYGFSEVYSYFRDYMDMFVDACKAMKFI